MADRHSRSSNKNRVDFKVRLGIIGVLLMAWSISRSVAAESLEALVEAGQYQAAYELAMTQERALAGEPRFDFLFALAALETGHPQMAVFALERVLVAVPQDHRARLELGRAYFVLGDFEKSTELFNQVLAADPPAQVRENVQLYLAALEQRSRQRDRQFASNVGLKLGYDSNINSATTLDSITLPVSGLTLALGETSRELSDSFAELDARARYTQLLRKDMGYFVSASFNEHQNINESGFDTSLLGLSGGYLYQSAGHSIRLPLQYQYLRVDGEFFRSSAGLGLEWSKSTQSGNQYMFFSQWAQQRYADAERVRDVDLALLGLGAMHGISAANLVFSASAYTALETSRQAGGEHFGRGYSGLRLGLSWFPRPADELQLGMTLQQVEHDAVHPLFSVVREDEYAQLSLDWIRRFESRWSVRLGVSYSQNDSNIDIYTYKRSLLTLGGGYAF
ncbi:MAG TPA: DUF2860 domain-containing protein [Candidatus Tenderia electrophaga]|uniref:DUF2860 domain-containing protein n=1 Tax=Candidatus Tenderia electrophaga TaxID=1748243 RepID=A0A832J6N3_9GAMM|nr:DUF2860 domain-containing protein [Candidatus Tenderia electrophaga]